MREDVNWGEVAYNGPCELENETAGDFLRTVK
jgi:hypothetical protein